MSEIDSEFIQPIVELYVGECHSITGRSALTYVVGKDEAQGSLHLRIAANTGKGMWCKDWAPVRAVEAIVNGGADLTAKSFHKLHPGKSINTGGFVLAALRDLGLVRPGELNSRVHELVPGMTLEEAILVRLKDSAAGSDEPDQSRKVRRKGKEVA